VWICTQFKQQLRRRDTIQKMNDGTLGIIQIPEDARSLVAGFNAEWLLALPHALHAEIAFVHRAGFPVAMTGVVGAGLDAGFTADTFLRLHPHDSILTLL
jgi:hypothetical protein